MYLAYLCTRDLGVCSRGPRNLQLVHPRILLHFLLKFLQSSTQQNEKLYLFISVTVQIAEVKPSR